MNGLQKLFSLCQMKFSKNSSHDGFDGWTCCKECHEMVYSEHLNENHRCCPKCDHHFQLSAKERIELLTDQGSFKEIFHELSPCDPLNFQDTERYQDRIVKAQKKTGRKDALIAGSATIDGLEICLGVMDFSFMGGSMGSVVGEKITRLIELAIDKNLPVILVCASGGARMQESSLALMQMAKTSAALARLHEKKLPYISILTHPTTGGVTASFATLADIMLAEPGALIGFAGPRVVEQTIGQKLPKNAQRAEFLLEKGLVDLVCHRSELKKKVLFFLNMFLFNDKKDNCSKKGEDEKSLVSDKIQSFLESSSKKKIDISNEKHLMQV